MTRVRARPGACPSSSARATASRTPASASANRPRVASALARHARTREERRAAVVRAGGKSVAPRRTRGSTIQNDQGRSRMRRVNVSRLEGADRWRGQSKASRARRRPPRGRADSPRRYRTPALSAIALGEPAGSGAPRRPSALAESFSSPRVGTTRFDRPTSRGRHRARAAITRFCRPACLRNRDSSTDSSKLPQWCL